MRVVLCDRCGKTLKESYEVVPVHIGWKQIEGFEPKLELCKTCANALRTWISHIWISDCEFGKDVIGGDEIEGKGI